MQTTDNQRTENRIPPDATVILPRLMTQDDLCQYLGKSTAWAERARWKGEGPQFLKLGRNIRYRATDVEAWLDENTRTATQGEA